jgi:hypothetical protein
MTKKVHSTLWKDPSWPYDNVDERRRPTRAELDTALIKAVTKRRAEKKREAEERRRHVGDSTRRQ